MSRFYRLLFNVQQRGAIYKIMCIKVIYLVSYVDIWANGKGYEVYNPSIIVYCPTDSRK